MATAETAFESRDGAGRTGGSAAFWRIIVWVTLSLLASFLINNYLTHWLKWPGVLPAFSGGGALAYGQLGLTVAFAALAVIYVLRTPGAMLRPDAARISGYNTFLIRAAFWAVVYVGVADAAISFFRVEGMLEGVAGSKLALELGKSQFRGAYVHIPLVGLGVLTAMVTRTLGFTWLALLVVLAELFIVIGRFVFSYEQAFMSDLVRFWYAALFLFASAYTLLEDGHVRVDVFYAGFADRTKGYVNAFGSLVMGLGLCWTILILGMWASTSIINSPVLSFETTQAGFGLYVKYLMAAYIGVFATSMAIQFLSYFLESVADVRGEPGKRQLASAAAH